MLCSFITHLASQFLFEAYLEMIPSICRNQLTQESSYPAFCFPTLEFDTTLIVLIQFYASCFNVECSCLIDIKDWLIGSRRNATCTFLNKKKLLRQKINRTIFIYPGESVKDGAGGSDQNAKFSKFKSFFGAKNQDKKPFYDVTIDPIRPSGSFA